MREHLRAAPTEEIETMSRANEMYIAIRESERDFMLRAIAGGADIGYDPMGVTWAVYDEQDAAEAGVVYLPTPRIGEVALASGDVDQWKPCPEFDGDDGRVYFYLTLAAPTLIFDPIHGWAVDADGDTSEFIWYPTPTVPADRIEDHTRELSLAAA